MAAGVVVAIRGVGSVLKHETVRRVRFTLADDLGGLQVGDEVRVGGFQVGHVRSIDVQGLAAGQPPYIVVGYTIPAKYPVAADAHLAVQSSLTGTTVLNFDALGTGAPLADDAELAGHPSTFADLTTQLGQAAPQVRAILDTIRTSTLPHIDAASAQLPETLAHYRTTADHATAAVDQVGGVFGDTKGDVRGTMANLHQITDDARARLPALLDRAKTLMDQTTATIADARSAMTDVRATAANARQLTGPPRRGRRQQVQVRRRHRPAQEHRRQPERGHGRDPPKPLAAALPPRPRRDGQPAAVRRHPAVRRRGQPRRRRRPGPAGRASEPVDGQGPGAGPGRPADPHDGRVPRRRAEAVDGGAAVTSAAASPAAGRRSHVWAAVACGLLLAGFAELSLSAVRTKSVTIDEPVHLASGLAVLRLHDYRIDPATPPLAKCWAALAAAGRPLALVPSGPVWADRSWDPVGEAAWAAHMLLDVRSNGGIALIDRAHVLMLAVGVAVGVVTAEWAGRLGGPVAAVVAAALFCLDPNFIGHAPLIKTDVPLALAITGVARQAWQFGRRATVARTVGLGLWCGAAVNVKFSGVLAGPIVATLLVVRACGSVEWSLPGGGVARSRPARLAVAAAALLTAAGLSWAITWACYGFRYRAAPSTAVRVDLQAITAHARQAAADRVLGRPATPAEVAALRPGPLDLTLHWADDHHLLPQAMVAGLLAQATSAARWPAFLNGQAYDDGRLFYYPLVVLYKVPLPTLMAVAAAAAVAAVRLGGRRAAASAGGRTGWAVACVAVPPLFFAAAALHTALNVGLRSVLPAFPFLYVGVGIAAAYAWRRRPTLTAEAVALLLGWLAVVTVGAWPDYVAFFNVIAGGPRGGFDHLADSNLDWGQDMTTLAAWERDHPGLTVYADLFAIGDPARFGVRGRPLWVPDYAAGRPVLNPRRVRPDVIAVSATHLRGLYVNPAQQAVFADLRRRPPMAVLGGTIYVYADPYPDQP